MPWHIESNNPGCSGYAVVKNDDGSIAGCHTTRGAAERQLAALYASEETSREGDMTEYLASITDAEKMQVKVPVETWEIKHTGRPDETFTVRGYAAVFDQFSHDMGGFRTKLAGDALDEALADPNLDVHFVWDHDTRYVGARTTNETLHLSTDSHGLFMDAQVGAYSWAKDLRLALERGDIDQGSIALTIAEDEWSVEDDESITRTVTKASGLYDVTVTAQGAFPQTSLAVAFSLVKAAVDAGRLPETVGATLVARDQADGPVDEGEEPSHEGGEGTADWKREQRNRLAVSRDEIAKLIERSKGLG